MRKLEITVLCNRIYFWVYRFKTALVVTKKHYWEENKMVVILKEGTATIDKKIPGKPGDFLCVNSLIFIHLPDQLADNCGAHHLYGRETFF